MGPDEESRRGDPVDSQGRCRRELGTRRHDPTKSHAPVMFTTDLAFDWIRSTLRSPRASTRTPRSSNSPSPRPGTKLTHRDMGPRSPLFRSVGSDEPQIWQDPVPEATHAPIDAAQINELKEKILASGLSVSQLVATAWASAATFRGTDKRGGANGARIRLAPQKDWEVNDSAEVTMVLRTLEGIQSDFNHTHGESPVSLADLIVLGGCAAVEKAAKNAGHEVAVPFSPGRGDACKRTPTSSPSPYWNRRSTGSAIICETVTDERRRSYSWNEPNC